MGGQRRARNRLAQLRAFKGLTVGEVSYSLGVSYNTVLAWERYGEPLPNRDNLLRLSRIYDVEVPDIYQLRKQLFSSWRGD